MRIYRLQSAFLPHGWTRDAHVSVSDSGFITQIDAGAGAAAAATAAVPIDGIVVPGMANAHSHAFQRAMAGKSEFRSSARDSFWSWRQEMYALANRIEPDDLEIVATQLFVEMLKAGYTSVAEFHYLHRRCDGSQYSGANALWDAVDAAAHTAGIGLTFLPTLYQTGDFGAVPLRAEQARFALDTDTYLRAVENRIAAERRRGSSVWRTGAAFHSLRAVPLHIIKEAVAALRTMDASMPLHIHVAEQLLEVKACLQATGRRPIELLMEHELLGPHWCLVHATHATLNELRGIAAAGAGVCVSVSTEANLGDGFFDTARYLDSGGSLCIGSDSQCTVNPAEELRWLEYQQRLRKKLRGVLATQEQPHVGTRLWSGAALHGAQAVGQPSGSISVGRRADWVVLDPSHPALAGSTLGSGLDQLVFAGGAAAIRHVMVAGRWVVKDRVHDADDSLRAKFTQCMKRLAGEPACSPP
jgi:formimidoylglutamate deiminase